jgi:5-methylcytosine-specific restriction endonuclease McrA
MPSMPPTFRPAGNLSRQEANRTYDARRGSARERGYTSRWDKAAKGHLASSPLCRYCALVDQTTAAELVDHLYPHKGDQVLFWNSRYWISSCRPCHDTFKQRTERLGGLALDNLARRLGLPTITH